jgi:lipopolysaccharide transport system ATP-binding protein
MLSGFRRTLKEQGSWHLALSSQLFKMTDTVIKAENLGKQYKLGLTRHDLLSEKIMAGVKGIAGITRRLAGGMDRPNFTRKVNQHESPGDRNGYIWALKDVSFEVKRGEVVGIIGRNGAGKSTLLKILTRITEPTKGRAWIKGRVGSLLEVGTGFHQELTGRENIFLNGAILGMTRAEIKRKFDEIVEFSEVEKFIDTPVKRYSSGMYVRLAFAVAAHLEPEILLVDEVLAVGDFSFQKKCLGKMGEVAKEGRTVLFVSHNMAVILNLCAHAFLIEDGQLKAHDVTEKVVRKYIQDTDALASTPLDIRKDRQGNGKLRFVHAAILNNEGKAVKNVMSGEDIAILLSYRTPDGQSKSKVSVSVSFYGPSEEHLFTCWTAMMNSDYSNLPSQGIVICKIPKLPLAPGTYSFNIYSEVSGLLADWVPRAVTFDVLEGDYFGTGRLPPKSHGGLLVYHQWEYEEQQIS